VQGQVGSGDVHPDSFECLMMDWHTHNTHIRTTYKHTHTHAHTQCASALGVPILGTEFFGDPHREAWAIIRCVFLSSASLLSRVLLLRFCDNDAVVMGLGPHSSSVPVFFSSLQITLLLCACFLLLTDHTAPLCLFSPPTYRPLLLCASFLLLPLGTAAL
jgi:hypothetical protein